MDKRLKDIISIFSPNGDGKVTIIYDESDEIAMKIPLTFDSKQLDAIRRGDMVRGIIKNSFFKEGDSND